MQKWVKKKIFEPETTLIKQYIIDSGIRFDELLFKRTIHDYNRELQATQKFFENTDYPLKWKPTTHTSFKHTCVSQMSGHGVRLDTISRYIGTDPTTLNQFYRGGSDDNIDEEIGGLTVKKQAATWRGFVIDLTRAFAARYEALTGVKVVLPVVKGAA